ncbi:glucose-1-phosphate adenylyltransferase [Bacillus lacus]|uniref:Glucose-1-phosphate adenylyltransferase n=2 Tax=Metabacillus lacus TaxID=1983721 RepID=A0A7X2LYK3_9BACI|nr:sugar phosphate nucleotidyltransferase [Metabacillus lacus]MRX72441.1 glucose-1-phosphate adenylyltransferase [Metabacillus lacus]
MAMNMLGIIDATTYKEDISDLIKNRSMAAIPFGGRYRLIDFVLSNMVNSGIRSVAIFPKYQYRSLMDHLGSGKQWDLNRKRDGLFFFPSPTSSQEYDEFASFRQFSDHLDYFSRSSQEYAVIANSYTVCNIDLQKVLHQHLSMGCDITEVTSMGKPLEIYILSKDLLLNLIHGYQHTGFRTLQEAIANEYSQFQVCQYEHGEYAAVVDSIQNYYQYNLDLLKPQVWKQLFMKNRPILTKVKDEPPTKYYKESSVKNSIIANGCKIEGTVENSIIFRSVHVGKGTVIKNSIIMQKSQVQDNCFLENVVLDKDVKLGTGVELRGSIHAPQVLRKGTVQGALMNS